MIQHMNGLLDTDDSKFLQKTHYDTSVMAAEKVGFEMRLKRKRHMQCWGHDV